MSIQNELSQWPLERLSDLVANATPASVSRAIAVSQADEPLRIEDLAALLSPAARPQLETMAREAQRLTLMHFGRTIQLYAPVYVSNVCRSNCVYCGFKPEGGEGVRATLTEAEMRLEYEVLSSRGFRHLLLVSGEAPTVASPEYLAECVRIAREYFPSVSVEVYALTDEEYFLLCEAGLEGVTLYMETYDRDQYARMHRAGRKRDYDFRLESYERAGRAGARKLNLGILLGLFNWREDVCWLAIHARYLQRACWRSSIALSFPRLRNVPDGFAVPSPVGDAHLVQIILALRMFLPESGFTLSTRESASLRDRLIPLGITQMSAGSSTRPGGYAARGDETLEQFAIDDARSPEVVAEAIRQAGYAPVWKDFDSALV